MDSYVKLTGPTVALGENTLTSVEAEYDAVIYKEILRKVCSKGGGIALKFECLTQEIFKKFTVCIENPVKYGDEGYIVDISDEITIYHTAEISKIYALNAIIRNCDGNRIKRGIIYNTPKLPFRCVLTHLPSKEVIPEYKKFIDMMLAFGHNTLMVEVHGAMEYKRHPEINEGWVEYCKFFKDYNEKEYGKSHFITRIHHFPKNSIGIENADGGFLTQEELGDIVAYCKARHMEIVPNVPTFSHADYILIRHPEFAECPDEPLPSNICPSNEDYYKLVFDIFDEVIEVFKPERINIGHDEAYVYGQCPKCKRKSHEELFGNHIMKLHDYLKQKGVKTMLWADGILPTWHGGNAAVHERMPWDGESIFTYNGKNYPIREFKCHSLDEWAEVKKENPDAEGWYVPEKYKSIDLLSKDVQAMNWSWGLDENAENFLVYKGLFNVYGNFTAIGMKNFDKRIQKGVSGISLSAWCKSDLESLQRSSVFFSMGFNGFACWNHNYDESKKLENTFFVADAVYKYVNAETLNKRHIEITHTTVARIEHPPFCDGYHVVTDDYIIGDYEITYTDGTSKTVPICWGYNIGSRNVIWDNAMVDVELSAEAGGYSPKYRYEPIGGARLLLRGKETLYVFSTEVEKDVETVTVKPRNGYDIELVEWSKAGGI